VSFGNQYFFRLCPVGLAVLCKVPSFWWSKLQECETNRRHQASVQPFVFPEQPRKFCVNDGVRVLHTRHSNSETRRYSGNQCTHDVSLTFKVRSGTNSNSESQLILSVPLGL
jgi:hypothetical protein